MARRLLLPNAIAARVLACGLLQALADWTRVCTMLPMPLKAVSSVLAVVLACAVAPGASLVPSRAVHTSAQFGGGYAGLGARRQRLIDDWVARFNQVTNQTITAEKFYDGVMHTSTKTTFDAVTHALMTTGLTEVSGTSLGDALELVEHVDTVKGAHKTAPSDHQFRMYVRLSEQAASILSRSSQFKRGADNTVYHKGYPTNYRQQGGTPSLQISIAADGRRADVDVDYRSASFPASIFNGHLTAANSDVRAGDNADRHTTRWLGLESWWRSFFGVRLKASPDDSAATGAFALPAKPRAGDKPIATMVYDFLTAWLIEGNIVEAMGYISPRALSCLAMENDDPAAFDRGMAPLTLMQRMRAARDVVGPQSSLADLTVGVRLASPALRVVTQPHHAQVVVYSVPDDVAAEFNCESRVALGVPTKVQQRYGTYHGAVFYIKGAGGPDYSVALLWARENGHWKIISWRADAEDDETPPLHTTPETKPARMPADRGLVAAARGFLESLLIRKDYDAAFKYFAPASYPCHDLGRPPGTPRSESVDDAGHRLRASLESVGSRIGPQKDLSAVLRGVEPAHPAVRVMDHADSRTFSLSSLPDGLTDAADCAVRARGEPFTGLTTGAYGRGFAMTAQFHTQAGDAPVIRMIWLNDNGTWRITAFDVQYP